MKKDSVITSRIRAMIKYYSIDPIEEKNRKPICVRLPKKIIDLLDTFVESGLFISRSELIRIAIITYIKKFLDLHQNVSK